MPYHAHWKRRGFAFIFSKFFLSTGILCPHTGKNKEADVSITNAAKCQGSRARVTVGEIIV